MARFLAILALMCCSACATYTITEDKVFTPVVAYEAPAEAEDIDLSLMWEDVFQGLTSFKIEVEAWFDQKVSIEVKANEFEAANVRHGYIDTDQTDIAYTLIERAGAKRPLIVHCGGNTAARPDSGTPYGLKPVSYTHLTLPTIYSV